MEAVARSFCQEMVLALFQRLEREGIRYALLRNYEDYPDFGHDIDICLNPADSGRVRQLVAELAGEQGWMAAVECDHYHSHLPFSHIEVFYFYNSHPLCRLHLDVFYGMPLWGVPLFSWSEWLTHSVYDEERRLRRLDGYAESLMRVMQISRLLMSANTGGKVNRYCQKVAEFCGKPENKTRLEDGLRQKFGPIAKPLLNALLRDDQQPQILRYSLWAKSWYFTNTLLKHPVQTISWLLNRVRDYIALYWTNACGYTACFYVADTHDRKRLRAALDLLLDAKALYGWTDVRAKHSSLNFSERCAMERGHLIVKHVESSTGPDIIDVSKYLTVADLIPAIIEQALRNHQVLYRQPSPNLREERETVSQQEPV